MSRVAWITSAFFLLVAFVSALGVMLAPMGREQLAATSVLFGLVGIATGIAAIAESAIRQEEA